MKEFLSYFLSFFIASILSDVVYGWFGFEYEMFRDQFHLLYFLVDIGVFLVIGLTALYLLRKYFMKEES